MDGLVSVYPIFAVGLNGGWGSGSRRDQGCVALLDQIVFVVDREAYEFAEDLMERFGESALAEAAQRAEHSRDLGNHIHYTRWCRVGRAILLLGDPGPSGTVH